MTHRALPPLAASDPQREALTLYHRAAFHQDLDRETIEREGHLFAVQVALSIQTRSSPA